MASRKPLIRKKKIIRVLLLNPPDASLVDCCSIKPGYTYFEPPLGLLYIYSFLKRNVRDTAVRIVDLNIEMGFKEAGDLDQAIDHAVNNFVPDVVGISAIYYSSIPIYHKIAQKIKALFPEAVVVFGGHYPTHLTDDAMNDKAVDFAILSEGELGMADLLSVIAGQKDIENLEGIAYRGKNHVVKIPRRHFWKGFSDFGALCWEDLPMRYYFQGGRNVLTRVKDRKSMKIASITATRGCPNACTFCSSKSFWRRRWRKRRIERVIDEIRFLMGHYGINTIVFNDENICTDKKWLYSLLDRLEKLNITWLSGGGLSVRALSDEALVKKMYKSGIGLFNIAIESGSDEVLSRVKKPSTVKEVYQAIRNIRENGDAVIIGFFITGFPFEKQSDLYKTYDFAQALDLDWKSFYCFQPFPGSELFDYCIENRLIDGFDASYGENYFSPDMKHIDYTSDELSRLSYMANLKCNFIHNRNLKRATEASLKQAERDFKYVLEMVPNHVFAMLGLAEIMKIKKKKAKYIGYLKMAKQMLKSDNSLDWQYYLNACGYNIDSMLEAASAW